MRVTKQDCQIGVRVDFLKFFCEARANIRVPQFLSAGGDDPLDLKRRERHSPEGIGRLCAPNSGSVACVGTIRAATLSVFFER